MHKFRVALRRLRTLLKVFDEYFDEVASTRDLKGLRKLSRAFAKLRDAQAELELLHALPGGAAWPEAGSKVAARLERRIAKRAQFPREFRRSFKKLDRSLRRRLKRYEERVDLMQLDNPPSYRLAAQSAIAALALDLRNALSAVQSRGDESGLHELRLAAKRLRYTLESIEEVNPGVTSVLQRVVGLQDSLGQLRDGARLRDLVVAERNKAGAHLGQEFGYLGAALAHHADDNYARLQHLWLGANGADFFAQLAQTLELTSPTASARSAPRPDPAVSGNPLLDPFSV